MPGLNLIRVSNRGPAVYVRNRFHKAYYYRLRYFASSAELWLAPTALCPPTWAPAERVFFNSKCCRPIQAKIGCQQILSTGPRSRPHASRKLTSKKWRHSYPPVDVRETCAHLPTSGRPETASGVLRGSYFFHTCLKLVDPENGLLRILWFWFSFTRLCFLPRIRIWELLKVTQLLEWCSNSWSSIGLIKTFKNERVSGLQEIGFPRRANSNPGFTRGRQLVSFRFKIASLCHRVGWLAAWSIVCWWVWWIWLCWLGPFVRLCFALDLFFSVY